MTRYKTIKNDIVTPPLSNGLCRDLNNILKDLDAIDHSESRLLELRTAKIREIVRTILSNPLERECIFGFFKQLRPKLDLSSSDACHLNFNELNMFFRRLSAMERITACREMFKMAARRRKVSIYDFLDEPSEQVPSESKGKISYFKNSYADEAFIVFNEKFGDLRSSYAESFARACENVYDGTCEYCILPIESSKDGKLSTFYSLIDKYELKIEAVCDIEFNDTDHSTSFALLKKSIRNMWSDSMSNMFFEIRFTVDQQSKMSLADILTAAEYCSMRIIKIDSVPLPYSDKEFSHYIVFGIDSAELVPFLLYLLIDAQHCIPIGIYKKIRPKNSK